MISIRLGNNEAAIDPLQYQAALNHTARLITFQDGIARHITMRDACWSIADGLEKGKGWPVTVLPSIAWSTSLLTCTPGTASFEAKLRAAYEAVVALAATMQPVANNF